MDIEKGKIVEVSYSNGNLKYKQVIKNNTLNIVTEIEGENLNELLSVVRNQIKMWNNLT